MFALNSDGYKKIIELSSKSYLDNDGVLEPHLDIDDLLKRDQWNFSFSGTIFGLIGKLFDKINFKINNFIKT